MLYQNVAVANDYCLKDLFEWITRRTVPDFQCFENKLGSTIVPLQVLARPVRLYPRRHAALPKRENCHRLVASQWQRIKKLTFLIHFGTTYPHGLAANLLTKL